MKRETLRMLNIWRNETIEPIQGVIVRRDYNPCDDGTIELMWFADYQRDCVDRVLKYIVSNFPDNVSAINNRIDVVEQNELRNLLQK